MAPQRLENLPKFKQLDSKNFCFEDKSGRPQSGRVIKKHGMNYLVALSTKKKTTNRNAVTLTLKKLHNNYASVKYLNEKRVQNILKKLEDVLESHCKFKEPAPTPTDNPTSPVPPTPEPTPIVAPSETPQETPFETPSPSPHETPIIEPTPSATPISVLNGDEITINPSNSATDVPIQIGRTFIKGEIPDYPQAVLDGVPLLTQADVKTRWEDGSVNHAVISFILSSQASTELITVGFVNQASGNNTNFLTQGDLLSASFDFDASISITDSTQATKIASARHMIASGNFTYWLKGSVATSIIISDHSTSRSEDLGFDSYNSLRPIFHATFYPALNKVKVRFIGEIANTIALQDMTYNLDLTLGYTNPVNVYTKSNFLHTCATRWTKEYWIGGPPPTLDIDHNLNYLTLSKGIPNYDPQYSIQENTRTLNYNSWNNILIHKDLGDTGLLQKAMGTAGGREDIGPVPGWHARWLYTGDARMAEIALKNSELAGRWPMHLREGRAGGIFDRAGVAEPLGRVVSISNRPTLYSYNLNYFSGSSVNTTSDRLTPVGTCSNQGWVPDRGHQPDLFSVPYLLTGDYFYLEELQFWASFTAAFVHPGQGDDGRGPSGSYGHIGPIWGVRNLAWPLRNRAIAAYFTPDGEIEKEYFRTLLFDVLATYEGMFNISSSSFPGYDPAVMRAYGAGAGKSCRNGPNSAFIPCSPLGLFDHGSGGPNGLFSTSNVIYGTGSNSAYLAATPWMHYYLLIALETVTRLGFPGEKLLNYAGQAVTGQLTEPGYNPYLIGQYRWGTVRATPNGDGTNTITPFQSWTDLMSAFSNPAQVTTSFNATSQYADPNNPDQYVAVFHAASRGVLEYAQDQNLAADASGVWNYLFPNESNRQNAFNTGNPKWALRCSKPYC